MPFEEPREIYSARQRRTAGSAAGDEGSELVGGGDEVVLLDNAEIVVVDYGQLIYSRKRQFVEFFEVSRKWRRRDHFAYIAQDGHALTAVNLWQADAKPRSFLHASMKRLGW